MAEGVSEKVEFDGVRKEEETEEEEKEEEEEEAEGAGRDSRMFLRIWEEGRD